MLARIVGIACLFMTTGAQALPDSVYQMRTGNDLYALCTEGDVTDEARCLNWVIGFKDGIQVAEAMTARSLICYPQDSNVGQARDVIVAFLRNRPADRHRPITVVAFAALAQAFPCRNSN